MKKFGLLILILLLVFSSATVFVNICSALTSRSCHCGPDECCIKSSVVAVESGKVFMPAPKYANYAHNFSSKPVERRQVLISNIDLSHLLNDYSCIVKSVNPSNAPPTV